MESLIKLVWILAVVCFLSFCWFANSKHEERKSKALESEVRRLETALTSEAKRVEAESASASARVIQTKQVLFAMFPDNRKQIEAAFVPPEAVK